MPPRSPRLDPIYGLTKGLPMKRGRKGQRQPDLDGLAPRDARRKGTLIEMDQMAIIVPTRKEYLLQVGSERRAISQDECSVLLQAAGLLGARTYSIREDKR